MGIFEFCKKKVMLPKMVGDMLDFHPCLKKPSSVIYWKLCVYTSIVLTT